MPSLVSRGVRTVATALVLVSAPATSQSLLYGVDLPGARFSTIGDVDSDGFTDFVSGQPNDSSGGAFSGVVRAHSGRDGSELLVIPGRPGDQLGEVLGAAGDVDADGCPDILVGGPGANLGGIDRGYARVYSGSTGLLLHHWPGEVSFERLGRVVAAAGDLDRDGHDDVWVAANESQGTPSGLNGVVYGYSGRTGERLQTIENPGDPGPGFAASLEGVEDLNGDGQPDLHVGNYQDPVLWSFSGSSGSVLQKVSTATTVGPPSRIKSLADLDLDGVPELALSSSNSVGVISGATGRAVWIDSLQLGSSIALDGVHDFDGDGLPDVLVGAGGSDWGADGAGRASLHSGSTGEELALLLGGTGFSFLGSEVFGLDDLNGDGRGEVLLRESSGASVWSLELEPVRLDFEAGGGGTSLTNGTPVVPDLLLEGILRLEGLGGHHHGAALFDSRPSGPNDPGPDPDLLVDRGNILILQENGALAGGLFSSPDDSAGGGSSRPCSNCRSVPCPSS